DLRAEMVDRFGPLPEPAKRLFQVTAVRLKLQQLGIRRMDLGESGGRVEYGTATTADPLAVVQLVQREPNTYRLEGATLLRVSRTMKTFNDRLEFAERLLGRLAPAPISRAVGA